jgi:hypothetical protein
MRLADRGTLAGLFLFIFYMRMKRKRTGRTL